MTRLPKPHIDSSRSRRFSLGAPTDKKGVHHISPVAEFGPYVLAKKCGPLGPMVPRMYAIPEDKELDIFIRDLGIMDVELRVLMNTPPQHSTARQFKSVIYALCKRMSYDHEIINMLKAMLKEEMPRLAPKGAKITEHD